MKSVLLIEDDEPIAEMLRSVFEREGFRLLHAKSGEEALDRLRVRSVNAVLLDLNLPGMDGIETCRRLRELSRVPVIILTARDDEVDKVVGLEAGADDYVTKPFSPRELLARVKAVLRRAEDEPPAAELIEVEGFEIDSGRRQVVTPSGDSVPLTGREFDLLWYLAQHRGMVRSRAQILRTVWGYDYYGETRTVDVHVRQLRKKLAGLPLTTVWGVGYQLER
ncbi:MAG TPA: response regulator transcription factor [Acidimicrobiia bacterium]